MSPPTFYLETSVWGTLGPRQRRDRKEAVKRLLRLLDGVRGLCVISRLVVAEIVAADPDSSGPILKQLGLVSWNHRHMTRPLKRVQFETVNRLQGYLQTPLICNPFEACDELGHR